ncbi:hypothetical protein ACVFYP_27395 [Roseomonas sp. F4]
MLTLRNRIARPHPLASAEFVTQRLHMLKVASRVIKTASHVCIAFAAASRTQCCSVASPAASSQPDHEQRGQCPQRRTPQARHHRCKRKHAQALCSIRPPNPLLLPSGEWGGSVSSSALPLGRASNQNRAGVQG